MLGYINMSAVTLRKCTQNGATQTNLRCGARTVQWSYNVSYLMALNRAQKTNAHKNAGSFRPGSARGSASNTRWY